jgi:hypothetical protein
MTMPCQTLCPYQLSSVRSVTSYIAQYQNVGENAVEAMVKARFNVRHIAELPAQDFRTAISFLNDLRIGEIRD